MQRRQELDRLKPYFSELREMEYRDGKFSRPKVYVANEDIKAAVLKAGSRTKLKEQNLVLYKLMLKKHRRLLDSLLPKNVWTVEKIMELAAEEKVNGCRGINEFGRRHPGALDALYYYKKRYLLREYWPQEKKNAE